MWQSDIGIINKVLVDYTHILSERPVWLIGQNSLWAIIIPSIWRGLPFAMLILLAGPAGDAAPSCTRRRRSTAPARGGASATSRCRCCGR